MKNANEFEVFDPFRTRKMLLGDEQILFLDKERPIVFISNGKVKRDAAEASGATVLSQDILDKVGVGISYDVLMEVLDKAERQTDIDTHSTEDPVIIPSSFDDAVQYGILKAQKKAQAFSQILVQSGTQWFPAFTIFSDSTNIALTANGKAFIINKAGDKHADNITFFNALVDDSLIMVNTGLFVLPPNLNSAKGEAYSIRLELGRFNKTAAEHVLPELLYLNRFLVPAFSTLQAFEHRIVKPRRQLNYMIQRHDAESLEPPLMWQGEVDKNIFVAILGRNQQEQQKLYNASFGNVAAAFEIARVIPG